MDRSVLLVCIVIMSLDELDVEIDVGEKLADSLVDD